MDQRKKFLLGFKTIGYTDKNIKLYTLGPTQFGSVDRVLPY